MFIKPLLGATTIGLVVFQLAGAVFGQQSGPTFETSQVGTSWFQEEGNAGQSQIVPSEQLLPATTRLWISLPNASELKTAFDGTNFGALTRQESLKPFVEKVSDQVKSWLDEKNMELGIKTDDFAELHTGEICLAAILPDDEVLSDYGFAIVVDVSETQARAKELQARLRGELVRRQAEAEEIELAGYPVTKWTYPPPTGLRRQKFAFHLLTENYFMVCDNQEIAREICRNMSADEPVGVLANSELFRTVRDQSRFVDVDAASHIQFYMEPFGYFDIVHDLARQNLRPGQLNNNHIRQFRESGFDAIQAIGGNVSIGGEYEILARAYVHAPANSNEPGRKYEGAGELLRFDNTEGHTLLPEQFVPLAASGYASVAWDMQRAFANVEPLFDRIFDEGTFQDLIQNIKSEGPRVDLASFVGRLDNQISVFTENTRPIDKNSEKLVLAFRVKEDIAGLFSAIERMIDPQNLTVATVGGARVLRDKEVEEDIPDLDIFDVPGGEAEEVVDEKPKPLFDERVYAVVGDYILLSNNYDYLASLLNRVQAGEAAGLSGDDGVREVFAELQKFQVGERASLRQFFKVDESLRVHYEMMRRGEMGVSSTLLAKLINQAMTDPEGGSSTDVRQQKIDGSMLPEDFDAEVAPYLGNGGIVLETVPEGWLLNGVILKKNEREAVATRQTEPRK